jgi:hypothetical protein
MCGEGWFDFSYQPSFILWRNIKMEPGVSKFLSLTENFLVWNTYMFWRKGLKPTAILHIQVQTCVSDPTFGWWDDGVGPEHKTKDSRGYIRLQPYHTRSLTKDWKNITSIIHLKVRRGSKGKEGSPGSRRRVTCTSSSAKIYNTRYFSKDLYCIHHIHGCPRTSSQWEQGDTGGR